MTVSAESPLRKAEMRAEPLLDVRRDTVRAFLEARGLPFREDPSNADRSIPRNRLRAELVPWLARSFNPRIVHVLGQQAELARDEWDWLSHEADRLIRAAAHGQFPAWTVQREAIRVAHPAIARTALREWRRPVSADAPAAREAAAKVRADVAAGRAGSGRGYHSVRAGARFRRW